MATVTPTSVTIGAGVTEYTWASMANGDVGAAVEMPSSADRTAQSDGTFGVGGTVNIQGSNNNVAWGNLNDADGSAIAQTADTTVDLVRENPRYIRPNVSAGDGSTNLTVIIVAKRTT